MWCILTERRIIVLLFNDTVRENILRPSVTHCVHPPHNHVVLVRRSTQTWDHKSDVVIKYHYFTSKTSLNLPSRFVFHHQPTKSSQDPFIIHSEIKTNVTEIILQCYRKSWIFSLDRHQNFTRTILGWDSSSIQVSGEICLVVFV